MNNFEIIILALALVFNSWISYLNAGLVLANESLLRKFYYTGITFLVQLIMVGAGMWVGNKMGGPELRLNMMISLSIMLILGMRILFSAIIRPQKPEKTIDYTDNKTTFFNALAEGITPLIIGIAIGILSIHPYMHWLLIGLFLFSGILAGQFMAARRNIKTLKFRPGPVSGLLLLASAIKLALSLTRF